MKVCKHCGKSNQFKARVIRGAVVEIQEDGSYAIKQESPKFVVEPAVCLACNAKINGSEDIVEAGVECPDCKGSFNSSEMIDGLCPTCYAKKQRPDIANMSPAEMIKRMIDLERELAHDKANDKSVKAEKTVEKVEEKKEAAAEEKKAPAKRTSKAKVKDEPKEETPLPGEEDDLNDDVVDSTPENVKPVDESAASPESIETSSAPPDQVPPAFDEDPF